VGGLASDDIVFRRRYPEEQISTSSQLVSAKEGTK